MPQGICPDCKDRPSSSLKVVYCKPCNAARSRRIRENKKAYRSYQREYYASKVEDMRDYARAAYRKDRQKPERVSLKRIRNLDLTHRRKAGMGKADPETVAYMQMIAHDPCSYCGAVAAGTVDHIVPINAGGKHHWSNLTAACSACNKSKQTKSLWQYWMYRLKVLPKSIRPEVDNLINAIVEENIDVWRELAKH